MVIVTGYYRLEIDDRTGTLVSLADTRRELLHRSPTPIPLFSLRLRTPEGSPVDVTAHDATTVEVERRDSPDGTTLDLHYIRLAGRSLDVRVRMLALRAGHLTSWRLALEHDTDDLVEWVRFPDLAVPDDLVGAGGEARLLWPAMEGVLVEDAALRERTWLRYEGVEYPSEGWEGFYPGACAAQFMAYCAPDGGLYLGAHDPASVPKAIEYYRSEGGIRLELRAYPGAIGRGGWAMNYDIALGVFDGDWHDAARIYRDWYDAAPTPKPPRLSKVETAGDPARPAWLADPPVVAIYPVRGETDTGDMTPNEYFPYARALPALDRLAATLDSPIMALLMHWEGTAPWAPPYVWPPFGGAAPFAEFVEGAHARGHLVGVYCSGIGWTQESLLAPYDRRAQFARDGLRDAMCLSPTGELPYSRICAGAQRWGYDLCVATPAAVGVAVGEVAKIAAAGVDYIQFFDQNIGGTPYFCYARDHGHPPAPGPWQVAAMGRLHAALAAALGALPRPPALGCEGAAAEPYQRSLPFNDLRYHMALVLGRPVPLYAYLYHERIANFMGNGVVAGAEGQAPDEGVLRARFAYSFVAGDAPAVVLGAGGAMHWGWGVPWDAPAPDQGRLGRLIRTLMAWRRGVARPYLGFGRMEKPYPVDAPEGAMLARADGSRLAWPAVLTSRWTAPDGRRAQVLVNHTDAPVDCTLDASAADIGGIAVVDDPAGEGRTVGPIREGRLPVALAPLSAQLVEFGAAVAPSPRVPPHTR